MALGVSDRWVTQFKSNKPWYFVSRYPNLTRGYEFFLEVVMAKDPIMGHELWSRLLQRKTINAQVKKLCKIQKKWLNSYVIVYLIAQSLHILVLWNVLVEYFCMLKMKMWIGCHYCSFVIPSKGPWRFIQFVHLIKNTLLQLFVKDLTCFCEFCLDSRWTKCQNV